MDLTVSRMRTNSQDDNEHFSDEDQLSCFRGRSHSVIAEETEDYSSLESSLISHEQEPSKNEPSKDLSLSKGNAISHEVKKMGLTANISHYIPDDQGFLVQKQRHLKGSNLVSSSQEGDQTFEISSDGILSSVRVTHHSGEHLERIRLNNRHVKSCSKRSSSSEDLRKKNTDVKCRHRSEAKISEIRGNNKDFIPTNSVDLVITPCDKFQNISDVEPAVTIFTRNEGLKRISSTGCLKKIQNGIKIIPDMPAEEVSVVQDYEKDTRLSLTQLKGMRRIHSSSDLENISALNTDGKIKAIQTQEQSAEEHRIFHNLDYIEGMTSDTNQSNNRRRPKSQGIMKWIKTNKIRQSKREMNTLSPNVF